MQPHFLLTKETHITIDKACKLPRSEHFFPKTQKRWRIAFVRKFLLNEKEIAKIYLTKIVAHQCSPIFY